MKTFQAKGKKLSEEITEYFKGAVSYSLANKLIRKKEVKVNGKRVKADFKTDYGDKIEIYYDGEDKRAQTVIYSDENVLVVYKPSGITAEDFYKIIKIYIKSPPPHKNKHQRLPSNKSLSFRHSPLQFFNQRTKKHCTTNQNV